MVHAMVGTKLSFEHFHFLVNFGDGHFLHLAWMPEIDLLNDDPVGSDLELQEQSANKAKEQEEEFVEQQPRPLVLQQIPMMLQQVPFVKMGNNINNTRYKIEKWVGVGNFALWSY